MSHCPMKPLGMGPECRHFRATDEPLKPWEPRDSELAGITTCTYWPGGAFVKGCGASMYCETCRHWRPDALLNPDNPKPGSLRICAAGQVTHAGSWCPRWEERTDEQVIEQANSKGRLF